MGKTIMDFLLNWGGSSKRVFIRDGLPKLTERLQSWYVERKKAIQELRGHDIMDSNLDDLGGDVRDLFESLSMIPQDPHWDGKNRTFGPTAAGKSLHLLLPNLCMIWDEKWVREPLGLKGDASSYLRYLQIQKTVLQNVCASLSTSLGFDPSDAVRWIESEHRKQLNLKGDDPITKILDEAIFDHTFRNTRIKPLVARRKGTS
jgi:hypothetical protein